MKEGEREIRFAEFREKSWTLNGIHDASNATLKTTDEVLRSKDGDDPTIVNKSPFFCWIVEFFSQTIGTTLPATEITGTEALLKYDRGTFSFVANSPT